MGLCYCGWNYWLGKESDVTHQCTEHKKDLSDNGIGGVRKIVKKLPYQYPVT